MSVSVLKSHKIVRSFEPFFHSPLSLIIARARLFAARMHRTKFELDSRQMGFDERGW